MIMTEEKPPQVLPSLSSWAGKGIYDPEVVAVSSVPVADNGFCNFIKDSSSLLPPPPIFTTNFHDVHFVDNDDIAYSDSNGQFAKNDEFFSMASENIAGEYSEHTINSTPPPEVCFTSPSYSDVTWETENHRLPFEEAVLENAYWQSALLTQEDELRTNSDDQERTKKLTGHQRIAANKRERRRMNTINHAFEALRMHLPILECERKLSKADTLRVASDYIKFMSHILETTTPKPAEYGGRGDMLRITRILEPVPCETGDSNGSPKETTISVLLTWSKNRKLNNAIIKNGTKRIRAPIWNPEFPIRNQSKGNQLPRPDRFSLGQQFVHDFHTEPPSKMLRLNNISTADDRYVYNLGNQPNESMYVLPFCDVQNDLYGAHDMVNRHCSPYNSDYLQKFPEVPLVEGGPNSYYDARAILQAHDVHWQAPTPTAHSVDYYVNQNSDNTHQERQAEIEHFERSKRIYNVALDVEEFSQFVFGSPQQLYQTYHIQGRDITAL